MSLFNTLTNLAKQNSGDGVWMKVKEAEKLELNQAKEMLGELIRSDGEIPIVIEMFSNDRYILAVYRILLDGNEGFIKFFQMNLEKAYEFNKIYPNKYDFSKIYQYFDLENANYDFCSDI